MTDSSEQQTFSKRQIIDLVKSGLNGKKAGLNAALVIASTALFDKKDRYGNDYASHWLRVGLDNTKSVPKIIIGLLHDVVEDSDWELDDLREVGFSERIVNGVDGVTKRHGELYFDFIERCAHNIDSIDKKMSDLRDNTSMTRNEALMTEKEIKKTQVYIVSNQYLVAIKKHEIEPGTRMQEFMESRPQLYSAELLREYSSHYTPA